MCRPFPWRKSVAARYTKNNAKVVQFDIDTPRGSQNFPEF